MSESEREEMADHFAQLQRKTELLKTKIKEQSSTIPLPTVPTDATCGGCRWFGLCPNGQKYCVVVKSSWPERHWINGRYSTRIAALADLSRACVDYSRAKETA